VIARSRNGVNPSAQDASNAWIEQEQLGGQFGDMRLEKRFRALLDQLSTGVGESIPLVCQGWANTKAAYRFLSDERVSEAILSPAIFSPLEIDA
jgi:hypothetical protein